MERDNHVKRKLILLAATLIFLAGFGALLHSPPSVIDAISGATPKAKRAAQAASQLEGSYVLCFHTTADDLADEDIRKILKELALENSEVDLTEAEISFRLYVPETDYALVRYAKKLCDKFEQAGIAVDLTEYSNTMLLSRVVSGKYDVFLASEDFMDITALEEADYFIMDSGEMR
jgi:ABC-type amino acid transport substrate-binding protein